MPLSVDDINSIYFSASTQLQQFLRKRVRCEDTAADLLQEVYLKLPYLKPPPETEEQVRAWLYRVATNLSIDHIRTQQRRADLLAKYYVNEDETDAASSPEMLTLFCDEIQRIQALLNQLPPRCADILRLNRLEGFTHAEIATQLGISKSLVEKDLLRTLNHLRQALNHDDKDA